jgi:ABC-type antimicrobial peptide transport system permease subunit
MIKDLCRAGVGCMTDMSGPGKKDMYMDVVAAIMALLLSIVIVAFVGKYLWNTTVAELFTFARPVQSVWQIIGLMLFVSLVK